MHQRLVDQGGAEQAAALVGRRLREDVLSTAPREQLVLVTVPAAESTVVVPASAAGAASSGETGSGAASATCVAALPPGRAQAARAYEKLSPPVPARQLTGARSERRSRRALLPCLPG
ncbi:MAG: hypothetical protein ACRENE_31980 [Polyangiaceae bacterium]